jgi:hypothetical protein
VQPCIRPLIAAALAAGPDVIRGLGPNQEHALLPRTALVAGLPNRRFRPFRINVVITPAVPQHTNATSYCHRQAPSHATANQADRQVLSLINSAQAIRAILLASATATTLKGRSARSRVTQGYLRGLSFARRRVETAPITSMRRRYRSPCLDIGPSFAFPPVDICRGTNPIQAAKSRPGRKILGFVTVVAIAEEPIGPIPGIIVEFRSYRQHVNLIPQ